MNILASALCKEDREGEGRGWGGRERLCFLSASYLLPHTHPSAPRPRTILDRSSSSHGFWVWIYNPQRIAKLRMILVYCQDDSSPGAPDKNKCKSLSRTDLQPSSSGIPQNQEQSNMNSKKIEPKHEETIDHKQILAETENIRTRPPRMLEMELSGTE